MEFIHHVLYINLDKRPDRRAEIEHELSRMGLSGERIAGVDTAPHGYIGCATSHINALKTAREKGWENVLIVEDDFQFIVDRDTLDRVFRAFQTHGFTYDVLFLAYNLMGQHMLLDHIRGRATCVQTASGYIVHRRYYDTLIHHLEEGLEKLIETHDPTRYTNDQYWKSLQPIHEWYFMRPRIGIQRPSYSDIECRHVQYNV